MGAQFYFLVALCVIIGRYTVAGAEVPDSEGRYVSRLEQLKRRLFRESGYDATARPANNTAEPTTVHITIIFPDITHVALEDGWFTLKLWICTNWYDYRLTWKAEDYNRTFHITAKLTEVWWPKLEIVNAGGQDLNSFEDIVVLHPDGHIWVCPAFSVKAACAVDLSLFPNDEQVCSLRFASTAYNADEVKLLEGNVWGEYQSEASTEWNITEAFFFKPHGSKQVVRGLGLSPAEVGRTLPLHRHHPVNRIRHDDASALLGATGVGPKVDRPLTQHPVHHAFIAQIFGTDGIICEGTKYAGLSGSCCDRASGQRCGMHHRPESGRFFQRPPEASRRCTPCAHRRGWNVSLSDGPRAGVDCAHC